MIETLSFPGLGLEFDINRVAFTLPIGGGIAIYWYGIIIAAAFLAGVLYVMKRVRAFGLDGDRVIDVILGGVALGIVGARLYYVAFKWEDFQTLGSIFNTRAGGLAIYGGIIGAVIAGILVCKWRRVKLFPLLDLIAPAMLLGQSIGRWGNFVNIEAYGSNTSLPWGMTSPSIVSYLSRQAEPLYALGVTVDPYQPVHPTFLYESLWCLLGFLFLAWFTRRRRFDGQMALIYLCWYSAGRFFIEGLRTDSLLLGNLRVSQMLALLCVLGSAGVLIAVHSKIRRNNDPDYLPLFVNTDEGRSILAGTFYGKKDPENVASTEEDSREETDSGAAGDEEGGPDQTGSDGDVEPEAAEEETAATDGDAQTEEAPDPLNEAGEETGATGQDEGEEPNGDIEGN